MMSRTEGKNQATLNRPRLRLMAWPLSECIHIAAGTQRVAPRQRAWGRGSRQARGQARVAIPFPKVWAQLPRGGPWVGRGWGGSTPALLTLFQCTLRRMDASSSCSIEAIDSIVKPPSLARSRCIASETFQRRRQGSGRPSRDLRPGDTEISRKKKTGLRQGLDTHSAILPRGGEWAAVSPTLRGRHQAKLRAMQVPQRAIRVRGEGDAEEAPKA